MPVVQPGHRSKSFEIASLSKSLSLRLLRCGRKISEMCGRYVRRSDNLKNLRNTSTQAAACRATDAERGLQHRADDASTRQPTEQGTGRTRDDAEPGSTASSSTTQSGGYRFAPIGREIPVLGTGLADEVQRAETGGITARPVLPGWKLFWNGEHHSNDPQDCHSCEVHTSCEGIFSAAEYVS